MLVLSRKVGERISIGSGVELTVIAIHKNRVRLGFTAPPDVTIHREELMHRIQQAEEAAGSSATTPAARQTVLWPEEPHAEPVPTVV